MDFAKESRPRKFSEVLGHEKTILSFTTYAKDFSYPSVLFLEGLSGTGKSTCANIIASTINCENPTKNEKGYFEPCLKCQSCKSVINETWNADIHYYTGVSLEKQGVLGLEEDASLSPWHGGRKTIIIVDEFQDLGAKAKSATLQLLEKKRKECMFILCTMDVSSIDKSVLSRGQVYKFKPLPIDTTGKVITDQLDKIDPEEKLYPFEPSALVLLAQSSWGSARQALSNLQRCIGSQLYTVEEIEKELGVISEVKSYQLVQKLIDKDVSFFSDLSNIETKDFYNYSWVVLSSLNKSILTLDKDDWKYKSSKSILTNQNYKSLMNAYLNINEGVYSYWKEYIFNYYIGEYFSNVAPILHEEKRTRVPRS